ncbi:lipopolysaccharide biosynthesis protein [Oryzihumus sp.]|uniref:lipopolysaccharide biosynthesis protein n=1 Tax=Oryzihumus sp. TaxID=1968903 RepID=UPI002EDB6773
MSAVSGSGAGAAASRGVLGRGSIYTLGTAAPILANVAVVPVVTRMLGAEAYGVVATAVVVIQVAMMLGSFGMPSVITRQGILTSSGVPGARALLVRGSLMTMGLTAVVLLAAPWWTGMLAEPLRVAIPLALVAGAFFVVVENAQSLLRVLDRPGAFAALSAAATLGGPALGLALLVPDRSPERYLVGVAAGYAVAALGGLVLCLRGGRVQRERGDTRAALRIGLPVIPHLVALFLANGALVFLAGQLYGIAAAGRLQLALLVGSSPGVITSALNNSWAPIVYRTPENERGAVLAHTARDIGTLAAFVAGGVATLSPWLLRLVANAPFAPDELVPAVAIVTFGTVVSVAYLANVHLVFASGRSLGLSVVTPCSLLVGLLVALAVGRSDLVLLAVGFPATYASLAVGTAVLRRRVGSTRWNERVLVLPFLVGAVLCAAGSLLPVTGLPSLSRLLVAGAAGVGTLWLGRRVIRG